MRTQLCIGVLAFAIVSVANSRSEANEDLRRALHASFDAGTGADFAPGEKRLLHAPGMNKRAEAKPGLPASGEVVLARGQGKFGNGLRFVKKKSPLVFFEAEGNFPYAKSDWSGSVSFWLTPRAWERGQ